MSQYSPIHNQSRLSNFTVERALASIFWMDETGRIKHANETASINYGYSVEEFRSMNIMDVNHNFDPEGYALLWERFKRDQRFSFESSHWTKGGEEFPVEIFVNYVEFEGNAYNISFVLNITERKRKERLLRSVSEATATEIGRDYFKSLVENIATALNVSIVLVTECADWDKTKLRTLAFVKEGDLNENIEYHTDGTPCKLVMNTGKAYYQPKGVGDDYPEDKGFEGYMGIPIKSSDGEVIGHIAILNEEELAISAEEQEIMKMFADRAGVEIERKIADEKLINALEEVEQLKDKLEAENTYLQDEIKLEHNFDEIVTQSARFKRILNELEQVAITDASVLVLGESGTGKELLARAIHNTSLRKQRPLVKINCAALPANLIESELFGHEKGAFTGAISLKIGRFELADSGTIFLDEIGELPLELQSKLLRVLQEGEYERLGGTKTLNTNVRVIAATNRNLEEEVANGNFRADLFYRLNVFPINSLPLRERKEDIPPLVKHFVDKYGAQIGKKIRNIPKRVIKSLQAYSWPGNIRELENVIERALILSPVDKLELGDWIPKKEDGARADKLVSLENYERDYIIRVLNETMWRVSGDKGAAKILDMKPTTLESRMKKLGIKRGG